METQTGRRMVSRREYVAAQGKRTGLRIWGICLYGLTVIFALQSASAVMNGLFILFLESRASVLLIGFVGVFFLITGTGFWLCRRWANNAMRRAAQIDPGIPITRANTAHLPAPELLVRASEEPEQAQQAVLLRAATEGQESQAEQLLRASVGEEQACSGNSG